MLILSAKAPLENYRAILEIGHFWKIKQHFWKTKAKFWKTKKQFQEKRAFLENKRVILENKSNSRNKKAFLGSKRANWLEDTGTCNLWSSHFWMFQAKMKFQKLLNSLKYSLGVETMQGASLVWVSICNLTASWDLWKWTPPKQAVRTVKRQFFYINCYRFTSTIEWSKLTLSTIKINKPLSTQS